MFHWNLIYSPSQVRSHYYLSQLPRCMSWCTADGFCGSWFERAFFNVNLFNINPSTPPQIDNPSILPATISMRPQRNEQWALACLYYSTYYICQWRLREATVAYKPGQWSTSLPCCLQSGASYSYAQPWPGCAAIFPSLSPSSSMGHAFNCLHSPVDLIVKVADFPPYLVYSLFVVSSVHLYLEAKPTFTRCDNRLCHSWFHIWLLKPTPANHKCWAAYLVI